MKRLIDREKIDITRIAKQLGVKEEYIDMVLALAEEEMRNGKAPPGGISIMEASRKYGIAHSTISRWVQRGYIRVIERTSWRVYIDEKDLAKVVKHYRQAPGEGKWTVRKSLTPVS